MAIFPASVSTNSDLYVAIDNFSSALNGSITNSQTTITLASTTGLPTVGIVSIEAEKIKYAGISGNDLTGCTRGFSSTTAVTHANTTTVSFFIVEEHHNSLKDEVIAIEQNLTDRLGVSGTKILLTPSGNSFPALAFTTETDTGIDFNGNGVVISKVGQPIATFEATGIIPSGGLDLGKSLGIFKDTWTNWLIAKSGPHGTGEVHFDDSFGTLATITTAGSNWEFFTDRSGTRFNTNGSFVQFHDNGDTNLPGDILFPSYKRLQFSNVTTVFEHKSDAGGDGFVFTSANGLFGAGAPWGTNKLTLNNDVTSATPSVVDIAQTTINVNVDGDFVAQFDKSTTAGDTRFLLYDVDTATVQRVTVGAANSGGAGYKVLRIPN